jgi:hypothetical protein
MKARNFFLVIRGPKSEHHNAPFHPVILCTRRHTAQWESRPSSDGDTVLENMAPDASCWGNWLLVKYKGYDIDYGAVAHYFTLFDGANSRDVSDSGRIESLLNGATWWSYDEMPVFVRALGVKYPEDNFTKQVIWEDLGDCLLGQRKEYELRTKLDKMGRPEWLKLSTDESPQP